MLIRKKLKDQVVKAKIQETKISLKLIGSILVILSGIILFTDKIAKNVHFENNFGYSDTETFLWVLSQTLSPIFLIVASLFKPYKTSYLIPVYIYTIQFYWIFQPNVRFDNVYLQTYAIGACAGFILLIYVIYKINGLKLKKEKEDELFKKEVTKTINLLKKEVLAK